MPPSSSPSCLSVDPHDVQDMKDLHCHFFGCLEVGQRIGFLSPDNPTWERLATNEVGCDKDFMRYSAAMSLLGDIRRTRVLRKEVQKIAEDKPRPHPDLVTYVAQSRKAWTDSDAYQDNIAKVKQWRRELRRPPTAPGPSRQPNESQYGAAREVSGQSTNTPNHDSRDTAPSTLEPDLAEYLVSIINTFHERPATATVEKVYSESDIERYNLKRDVKAQVIKFELPVDSDNGVMKGFSDEVHDGIFNAQFPNQMVSVENLLSDSHCHRIWTDQPPRSRDAVRYIHVPCNNMAWVEECVKRYFDVAEDSSENACQRTKMTLRPNSWGGLEYGGKNHGLVHSRHMRSVCKSFSTDMDNPFSETTQSNVVLFLKMPFLHWETDRNRARMADEMERQSRMDGNAKRSDLENQKQERKKVRDALPKCWTPIKHDGADYSDKAQRGSDRYPIQRGIEDIFWHEMLRVRRERVDKAMSEDKAPPPSSIFLGLKIDKHRRFEPSCELAQYLIDCARLYEYLTTFKDFRLIDEYLFENPPLHPRKTLDQAYFWKLKSTNRRDRDQVVYRYTHADFSHRFRPRERLNRAGKTIHEQEKVWEWSGHGEYEDKHGCEQCMEDSRKLSRVVMVDQLWMWILDKETLVTFFPQRYGVGKNDPSGVHQSIRTRLSDENNLTGHVRSVFDLALIVLDECFDMFFNRAITLDRRPQIMDIFAESIGNVTNHKTIAFRHLWQLTDSLTQLYETGIEEGIPSRALLTILNVNAEAELQREIRDIIDELDIMTHIVKQQEEVIARFVKTARDILDPTHKASKPFVRIQHSDGTWVDVQIQSKGAGSDRDEAAAEATTQGQSDTSREKRPVVDQEDGPFGRQKREAFDRRAEDLLAKVADRIKELEGLKMSAETTAQDVNELLSLKQQQASVVQAFQALNQSEETIRQGRGIMLFTVVTIIFLPLSFMSSLFGMNALELTGDGGSQSENSATPPTPQPDLIQNFWPVTFSRQIAIMFPVSFAVVLLAVTLAFSPLVRCIFWVGFKQITAKFMIKTGLYRWWLSKDINPNDMAQKTEHRILKMRERVRLRRHDDIRRAREIADKTPTPPHMNEWRLGRRPPVEPAP